MKILFLDQFGQLGGAQRCLLDLLPAFEQRSWQVRAAIAGEGPFPGKLRGFGIRVDLLPECLLSSTHKPMYESFRYLRWCRQASQVISRLAEDFKPDLLYINGPRLIPTIPVFARIPTVFHAHSRLIQTTALWSVGAHLRLTLARVIACCRYVADSLRPYIPPERLKTVYNGVPDLGKARNSYSKCPVVGIVGRIEPEKGQLEFVRAAHLLHRELPNLRFLVIGAPLLSKSHSYFRQTVEESKNLPLTFAGWQNDISCFLREFDILVVPSRSYDAAPRVVVEAFSAGTPVVAFSSGGIPELIEDGQTGFLVETASPEALASRILQVLRAGDNVRGEVATNARRKWHADFQIELYQERICDIISDTAGAA